MKKILSIFLSATLMVTCLLSLPFATSAVITNPVKGEKTLLLDSSQESTDWIKGKENTDGTYTDTTFAYNSSYNFWDSPKRGYSNELLTMSSLSNGVTDLDSFEWEFEVRINGAWTKEAFLFNVDTQRAKNATVLADFDSISNISNCFAVAIQGSYNKNNYSGGASFSATQGQPKDSLRPSAITILIPDPENNGKLIPLDAIDFTTAGVKAMYPGYASANPGMTLAGENGYLQLDGITMHETYFKINISLDGYKLTVTVTQGEVVLSKDFILPVDSFALAPKGDFSITHGGIIDGSNDRANTTRRIRNIKIYGTPTSVPTSGLIFDSTALDKDGYVWADNNNAPTDVDVNPSAADGALKLPGGIATTPILNQNGYEDNILDDFTWEFKYKADDAANNETSFLFHVDTERENGVNGAYYPTTLLSKENMGLKNSSDANRTARLYMAVTLYGSADKFRTQANAWQNALTLDWSDRTAVYQNMQQFTTTNADYGATTKPVSYLVVKTVDNDGNPVANIRNDVYYNIKVTKAGNSVTYAIWQEGFKAETYSVAVCTLNDTQLTRCASGDFAVVQENTSTSGSIKDMKIYDGIDASAEDYSAYADYKTEYSFEESLEDIKVKEGNDIAVNEGRLNIPAGSSTIRVDGFDSSNDNLGDFILKYNLTENLEYSGNHDKLFFRREDHNNTYILRFRMYGGANSSNYNPGTEYGNGTASSYGNGLLYLEKVVDGTTVVLDKVPIGNGLIRKGTMTVKISAIGNEIKVWYAGEGVVYDEPLISVTDDSHSTGYLQYDFYGGDRYIDNLEIYDLTAKAAAVKIAATNLDEVNCNKLEEYADILAINDAQMAKFSEEIAAKAANIKSALDHKYGEVINPAATYFTTGTSTKTCGNCNTSFTIAIPATDVALDSYTASYADGKLTISWEYSEELIKDIINGAKITFNYVIADHSNSVMVNGETGASITLEGFNAERLNADLTYYLSAEYGAFNTSKLVAATTNTIKASAVATEDAEFTKLLEELNKVESAAVEGQVANNKDLVSNTIKADIKAATVNLRFVASQALIDALAANKGLTRTVTLYVTIDGLETVEIEIPKLQKVTMLRISGMSFEQLNGDITIKLGFEYAEDAEKNFETEAVTFECGSFIAKADTDLANAFEAYMTK